MACVIRRLRAANAVRLVTRYPASVSQVHLARRASTNTKDHKRIGRGICYSIDPLIAGPQRGPTVSQSRPRDFNG